MRILVGVIVAVGLLGANSAGAGEKDFSGLDLLSRCKNLDSLALDATGDASGFCAGFLTATLQAARFGKTLAQGFSGASEFEQCKECKQCLLAGSNIINNCLPDGVTIGQLLLMYQKWAKEHPKVLHSPAAGLVHLMFLETFPCEEGDFMMYLQQLPHRDCMRKCMLEKDEAPTSD